MWLTIFSIGAITSDVKCFSGKKKQRKILCFRIVLGINQFLKNNFLRLCFQRVHQPHPAHGVTGFQFLGDARRLHHAGQHGVHPLTRRPVNLQQVRVQLFTQNQAVVKAGPVFLQVALPHTAILADGGLRLLGKFQVGDVVISAAGVSQFVHVRPPLHCDG